MSLAGRLVLLVVLAFIGLGAATAAVLRVLREQGSTREGTAFASGDAVTRALLARRDALSAETRSAIAAGQPAPKELAAFVTTLVGPLVDASAGYCLPDGTLLVRETVGGAADWHPPRGHDGPPRHRPAPGERETGGLLPLDRDVVVRACQEQSTQGSTQRRFAAPRDMLFVTVAGSHEPFAAWALVRTPRVSAAPSMLVSSPLPAIVAVSVLLLVALCFDTLLQMRRGTDLIANALVALQDDLATPIPRPQARELARVADGLRTMSAHLAEARQREILLERKLGHARRLASLGRVVAGVAHEIRNPLAGVKLRLDAMARRTLDERSARDVSRSLAEVARLDAVVSSLLLVARREPASVVPTDVAALLDERLAALDALSSERAVRVLREGAGIARLDPVGFARAIDNLVRNAVEASPAGGVVTVEVDPRGRDLVVRVVDRGDGVPVSNESDLFEPFVTSKPDGTGLGLSLARAAIEAHGGSLSYERADGLTAFVIWLPGSMV